MLVLYFYQYIFDLHVATYQERLLTRQVLQWMVNRTCLTLSGPLHQQCGSLSSLLKHLIAATHLYNYSIEQ